MHKGYKFTFLLHDKRFNHKPEIVYYNPKLYEIRAFTNHEESWDLDEQPFYKQKPLEITKNKPEEKKKRDRNEEERQKGSQRGQSRDAGRSSSSPMGGLGGAGGLRTTGR